MVNYYESPVQEIVGSNYVTSRASKLSFNNSFESDLCHKSIPVYSNTSSSSRRSSPNTSTSDDWLSHSIEQVCRKTLYKNVQLSVVNELKPQEKDVSSMVIPSDGKVSPTEPKKSSLRHSPSLDSKSKKSESTKKSLIRRCSLRLRKKTPASKIVRFASSEDVDKIQNVLYDNVPETPVNHYTNCTPVPGMNIRPSSERPYDYDTVREIPVRSNAYELYDEVRQRLPFADMSCASDTSSHYYTYAECPDTPRQPYNDIPRPPESPIGHYLQWIIEQSGLSGVPSVQQWLKTVRQSVENECLSALQSKSLTKDPALAAILSVGDSQDAISTLQDRTDSVMATINHVTRRLEQGQWLKFCSSTSGLSCEVNELLQDYKNTIEKCSPYSRRVENHMFQILQKLREVGARPNKRPQTLVEFETVQSLMSDVKNTLQSLVNSLYLKEIGKIIAVMEDHKHDRRAALGCSRRAIAALCTLSINSPEMSDLITRVGAVETLLSVCEKAELRTVWPNALRVLTILCAQPAAIRQLESSGGIRLIRNILSDRSSSENERVEAVGLLTQITSPWVDYSGATLKGMQENLDQLIKSLTEMVIHAATAEVFLLASAAIANLSFLDPVAVCYLHKYGTVHSLITSCRYKNIASSIFVKDQISTIMANVSAEKPCHPDIVDHGGLTLLLSLLQLRPQALRKRVEIEACERVHQKSAIALARLCSNPATAAKLLKHPGVPRLVELCKHADERNNSDSVLVACLAALRKIAAVSSPDEIRDLQATELIKNELWATIQEFSNKNESYV